ncbi:MAG: hypothetical protein UU95_C0024G0023 [Parcubacteria group bacterium GW2011_GWC2_42_12]|uniref:Uncharacterized protein n=2 Tax=Candidatus Falkowiibacteriota TaxID=1752728 RepID=A0A1F5S9X6_9BACT|nr:MAG: hypothetical protein UU43_C0001G0108 [Candidatus Falkowbacteria bacterium GW2011_GWA2_41_14]KKS33716.1 MAG: hypothetical protein UU95_C0024G0023 [Parcubacteria group bacterium GW2011_GWC2_42_12]OGF23416.1 MAG: hypothetical protein A3D45_01950 [Candidatus Falkowbacteria bacterium RIFCSPHIGHO2_02_FULL_42_9]
METRYHRINDRIIVRLFLVLFLLAVFSTFFVVPALADEPRPYEGTTLPESRNNLNLKDAFDSNSGKPLNAVAVQGGGFDTSVTFEIIVSTVLTMALGLMGAIFLVLAIYAGYNWMMAGGNEERVEKSKQTLTNAIIGLIIVLAAYAMVRIIVAVVGGVVFKTT